MRESANQGTPVTRKGWITETMEAGAAEQRLLSEIRMHQARVEARHELFKKRIGTVFSASVVAAVMFGLFVGCLAAWNAVVG